MQLLDKYLNAVRFWLPAGQEDDIIAELGEDLRAEIADRESDLGHPLSETEASAILKRRGDPVVVAFGYSDIKPLISPRLIPIYWFVVRLVTLWILIPCFVLIVAPIQAAQSGNLGLAFLQTAWTLLVAQVFAFGIITFIFMSFDRSPAWNRAYESGATNWDPRHLPSLPIVKGQLKATPRATAIAEVVASVIFGCIWLAALWPEGQLRVGSIEISVAPVWLIVRWIILITCLASIAGGWFSLVRPYAIRGREWIKLGIDAVNLLALSMLLLSNEWIILKSSTLNAQALVSTAGWANFGIRISLGIAMVITGYAVIDRVLRLLRKTPAPVLSPNITL